MSEDWGLVTLPTSGDPEKIAIGRLKAASDMALLSLPPLVVTTSGGKDSSVCVELARRAGIPFEIQHNHTTADAPETVRFVRQEFARLENLGVKCTINYPCPARLVRYQHAAPERKKERRCAVCGSRM